MCFTSPATTMGRGWARAEVVQAITQGSSWDRASHGNSKPHISSLQETASHLSSPLILITIRPPSPEIRRLFRPATKRLRLPRTLQQEYGSTYTLTIPIILTWIQAATPAVAHGCGRAGASRVQICQKGHDGLNQGPAARGRLSMSAFTAMRRANTAAILPFLKVLSLTSTSVRRRIGFPPRQGWKSSFLSPHGQLKIMVHGRLRPESLTGWAETTRQQQPRRAQSRLITGPCTTHPRLTCMWIPARASRTLTGASCG